jgi:hypothetical protein
MVLLLFPARGAADSPRQGSIQFSDGTAITGNISPAPGGELKIQAGNQLRVLDFEQVREIRLVPEQEQMEQKWRFAEAGQTAKIKEGKPYPLRSLQATVALAGNQSLTGHLYAAALYVEGPEKTQKVILTAKQRGQEGASLQSLIYPARIEFTHAEAGLEATVHLKPNLAALKHPGQLAALTWGALIRLEAKPAAAAGDYELPSPMGQALFLAASTTNKIIAGWPKEANETLLSLIRTKLAQSEDFFDDRQLLGVFLDSPNADAYCLVMLRRKGQTTLNESRSQPWRLEILRWKSDPADHRLMLAGRGYFFRGILAKDQPPPAVELSDELWSLRGSGDPSTAKAAAGK